MWMAYKKSRSSLCSPLPIFFRSFGATSFAKFDCNSTISS